MTVSKSLLERWPSVVHSDMMACVHVRLTYASMNETMLAKNKRVLSSECIDMFMEAGNELSKDILSAEGFTRHLWAIMSMREGAVIYMILNIKGKEKWCVGLFLLNPKPYQGPSSV